MNKHKETAIEIRFTFSRLIIPVCALLVSFSAFAADPVIRKSAYESGDNKIQLKVVKAGRSAPVTVSGVETGQALGAFRANKAGKLEQEISLSAGQIVPCNIRVDTPGGSATRALADAPADCGEQDAGGGGGGGGGGGPAGHGDLVYDGPGTCLECHYEHALDVFDSTHYQWKGEAPDMINQSGWLQGKHAGAVNTYCGNITGNWEGCSSCHVGRGAEPEAQSSQAQLENIDCMICHQDGYKRKKVDGIFQPDTANMSIGMDEAVQTVHKPTRASCLQCHAKAGGGDAVKRGDLALATAHTIDRQYDVHMAVSGADLNCQSCHVPENHRFPGKGSDIRPTDLVGVDLDCTSGGCHGSAPHESSEINRHTEKVACQTCHIPIYAKNASDSAATEATEIDRSWQLGSDHTHAPYHPVTAKANNLVPVYRYWNRASDNYLLFDEVLEDWETGTYHTSIPDGAADDPNSKLYPFKYKTSDYPLRTESNQLIALDTSVFFASDDAAEDSVIAGLVNMGFRADDVYQWVITDTYQLLNHQVSPSDDALNCSACHLDTTRMDLQGELGFAPANSRATCASGCHSAEKAYAWELGSYEEFRAHHKKHREKRVECQACHSFNR
jgi:nitrate reductase cytochrome c-type subunit